MNETGKTLYLAAQQGLLPDVVALVDANPSVYNLVGWVLKYGEPLMIPDMGADPRTPQSVHTGGLCTYAGVPISLPPKTRPQAKMD